MLLAIRLFGSPVVDLPVSPEAQVFLNRLNQNGFFSSFLDAQEYLREYGARWLKSPEIILNIWEVYLLEHAEQTDFKRQSRA
jgi:hypothetical protein